MENRELTAERIRQFRSYLLQEEKSQATVEKYLRDVRSFGLFLKERPVQKEVVLAYKAYLQENGYAIRSINSMLASLNSLFQLFGWQDCKVRSLRLQQQVYCSEQKELTKAEYYRLLEAAKTDKQIYLVLQTICSTGIRVSELQHFTIEAVKVGEVSVQCKGKNRRILLPEKLKKMLLRYAGEEKIRSGVIFRNRYGQPLNRGSVWARMKRLCQRANVAMEKVFPHNLRKLFARAFYNLDKDIAKLADILGHSSINTTRIYIMSTGREHRQMIERLGLIFPNKKP